MSCCIPKRPRADKFHSVVDIEGFHGLDVAHKARVSEFGDNLSSYLPWFMIAAKSPDPSVKEFSFTISVVFHCNQNEDPGPSTPPKDWHAYLNSTSGPVASEDYMQGVEDLPVQVREL